MVRSREHYGRLVRAAREQARRRRATAPDGPTEVDMLPTAFEEPVTVGAVLSGHRRRGKERRARASKF